MGGGECKQSRNDEKTGCASQPKHCGNRLFDAGQKPTLPD